MEREEKFLFSVVEVTSLEKRERERGRSGVRLRVCSSTLAAAVTSQQELHALRCSLVFINGDVCLLSSDRVD
jgi:hypothetical protein